MKRSKWKSPYNTIQLLKLTTKYIPIKTYSRSSTILAFLFHKNLLIHNGKKFILVNVLPEMEFHKIGEFAQTRATFKFTKKDKKKKK